MPLSLKTTDSVWERLLRELVVGRDAGGCGNGEATSGQAPCTSKPCADSHVLDRRAGWSPGADLIQGWQHSSRQLTGAPTGHRDSFPASTRRVWRSADKTGDKYLRVMGLLHPLSLPGRQPGGAPGSWGWQRRQNHGTPLELLETHHRFCLFFMGNVVMALSQ